MFYIVRIIGQKNERQFGMAKSIFKIGKLKQHWTKKGGVMKPKLAFESENAALAYIETNKIDSKYQPYVCSVCGKWHLGH